MFIALAGCSALLGSLAAPASAQDQPWPVRLRQDMARLQQVEWRLRKAAGDLCPASAADIGVVLDDRRAYRPRDWPLLAETLGMDAGPVVAGIVPDGPAALAGLAAGDEIVAITGEPVDAIAARRKAGMLVAEALIEEIGALPKGQPLALTVRRGDAAFTLNIAPVHHCAARLVLEAADRGIDAHSDARNVSVSTGLVTLAQGDDELAMVAGHELAHIIHGDRRGGGIGKRRRMEDAADSLGLQLLHCAGYDAARGIVLFERLGKRDWLGFLRAPTHRSFGKRLERLDAEIPALACPPRPIPAQ